MNDDIEKNITENLLQQMKQEIITESKRLERKELMLFLLSHYHNLNKEKYDYCMSWYNHSDLSPCEIIEKLNNRR